MIGYAEQEVFSEDEQALLARAIQLVKLAPYEIDGEAVRCHELARAVAAHLRLTVADGWFGMVDHSWCWCQRFRPGFGPLPNILDVYAPGRLPQVMLVDSSSTWLPRDYKLGDRRRDIRRPVIRRLFEMLGKAS
jgi:hypothetical protein